MNVLEPSLYARARLPLAQAETLPPACYTSQEFYDEEIKRITGEAEHNAALP